MVPTKMGKQKKQEIPLIKGMSPLISKRLKNCSSKIPHAEAKQKQKITDTG